MTRSSSAVKVAVAALLLPACITGGGRPRQLYPGDPRSPGEVARLVGPIGAVDGQDVSGLGKSFTLLPGCHVVLPVNKVAQVDTTGGNTYVASVPRNLAYTFRMQARHTYEIEVRPAENTGQTSMAAAVRAWDRDEQGGSTAVAPITSAAEMDACQAENATP